MLRHWYVITLDENSEGVVGLKRSAVEAEAELHVFIGVGYKQDDSKAALNWSAATAIVASAAPALVRTPPPRTKEAGVTLSHTLLMLQIARERSGDEAVLIFEDGVVLQPRFADNLRETLTMLPTSWQLFNLNTHRPFGWRRASVNLSVHPPQQNAPSLHEYTLFEWHRGAPLATGMGCVHGSAPMMNLFSSGTVWRVSFIRRYIEMASHMFDADAGGTGTCHGKFSCLHAMRFRTLGTMTFDRVLSETMRRFGPPGAAFGLDVPEAACFSSGSGKHSTIALPWHLSVDSRARIGDVAEYDALCSALRDWGEMKLACFEPLTIHH